MKTIGLIVNRQKDHNLYYYKKTVSLLNENGFSVITNEPFGDDLTKVITGENFFSSSDAIVTLGGDGTILEIAAMAGKAQKPVLGVNLGHLGYLAQLESTDLERLPDILKKEITFEQRFMLKLRLVDNEGSVSEYHALNDIALSRRIVSNMLHVDHYSDNEFVYNFRSDGLIFATPTGSTAYSMSSGGPIVDCSLMDVILVTPACEHSLFSKSLIFSADNTLSCRITHDYENAFIIVDGKVIGSAENLDQIVIQKSEYTLTLFQPDGKRFYRVLNSKFGDGGTNEKFTPKSNN